MYIVVKVGSVHRWAKLIDKKVLTVSGKDYDPYELKHGTRLLRGPTGQTRTTSITSDIWDYRLVDPEDCS